MYENYKKDDNYKQSMYTHHIRYHIFIMYEKVSKDVITFYSLVCFSLRSNTLNLLKLSTVSKCSCGSRRQYNLN